MARSFRYQFGVRLTDGTEHLFQTNRVPRFWKSWVMQQCPYGTVFTGCKFLASLVEPAEARS